MCMGNANIKLEERHAFSELSGVRDPSDHDTRTLNHWVATRTKLCVFRCASKFGISSRLSFSAYNKLGDKKMYAKQHYYALSSVHVFSISLTPCRLIIERQYKILHSDTFLVLSELVRSCSMWCLNASSNIPFWIKTMERNSCFIDVEALFFFFTLG